jgi:hypothetical protein
VAGAAAAFAVFFAAGGSAQPVAAQQEATPVVEAAVPCCLEVVQATPAGFSSGSGASQLFSTAAPAQLVAASRWRIIDVPQLLPAGIAPERGLQVKTILVARSISVVFPEIHSIGGVRPDALRWHPDGLALDVMVPNPSSSEGIRLGNEIVAYALKNADRFGLQDAIWRGVYYTPEGPQSSVAGHFDHVHLTTRGGGYPTGGELYYR